jgi:hypothetical protein
MNHHLSATAAELARILSNLLQEPLLLSLPLLTATALWKIGALVLAVVETLLLNPLRLPDPNVCKTLLAELKINAWAALAIPHLAVASSSPRKLRVFIYLLAAFLSPSKSLRKSPLA